MANEIKRDDRGMRIAAIVLVVSCGAPQAQPTSAVIEERPADWWIAKPTAPQDAAVTVVEVDAVVVDPLQGPPADSSYGSVRDALKEEGATIDGEPTEPEPEPTPDGVTFEDDVMVVKTNVRRWCAKKGKTVGFCWTSLDGCQKRFSATCVRADAYACFTLMDRTTGESSIVCLSNYGLCDLASDYAVTNPNVSNVTECVVRRYDPKWKPKKK